MFSGLSWARHYTAVKGGDLEASVLGLMVNWDPKGMGAADLRAREEWLDAIGSQLVGLRRKFDRESAELAPKLQQNHVHITAAEDLEQQTKTFPEGSAERAQHQQALDELLGSIEEEQSALDQAKADMADTKSWLEEREVAHKEAVASLRQAKSNLDHAQSDLARANQRRDREQEQTDQARVVTGLAVDGSKLDKALNAMRAATEQANQAADEARLKRESLAPKPAPTANPIIAAAVARASGQPAAPTSASERIAALKAKAAA
jgi:chromosome segregation ATPase